MQTFSFFFLLKIRGAGILARYSPTVVRLAHFVPFVKFVANFLSRFSIKPYRKSLL